MFKAPAAVGLTRTWDLSDLRMFPWRALPALSGDILAVMFVTAITMLLNTTGIEFITRREADLQRELTTLGVANLGAAALGGYVSCISLSRTTLNYAAGGRGRLCGIIVAAISVLVLTADPGFLAYVPHFVLGGLLLYLGTQLIYAWLIDSARRISLLEYASLLAITLLIIQMGFIAGVLIGVIIGCATFAVSASRVSAVKFSFYGSEYRSSLDRGPEELRILADHGREIQGMSLQSYFFFGSANRLYEQVKELFAQWPGTRFLLFDFRLVTGIDSSAVHSFTRSSAPPMTLAPRLVLVNLSRELVSAFRNRQFMSQDTSWRMISITPWSLAKRRSLPLIPRRTRKDKVYGSRKRLVAAIIPSSSPRIANGSRFARTRLSPRKAPPPTACISFSKGASASW